MSEPLTTHDWDEPVWRPRGEWIKGLLTDASPGSFGMCVHSDVIIARIRKLQEENRELQRVACQAAALDRDLNRASHREGKLKQRVRELEAALELKP